MGVLEKPSSCLFQAGGEARHAYTVLDIYSLLCMLGQREGLHEERGFLVVCARADDNGNASLCSVDKIFEFLNPAVVPEDLMKEQGSIVVAEGEVAPSLRE